MYRNHADREAPGIVAVVLPTAFFERPAPTVARELVGKVLRRRIDDLWCAVAVVEAEAYHLEERGSHASLGRTPSRESLWAPAGTIYMYWSRAGDSLNVSVAGDGAAVLFKSGRPWIDDRSGPTTMATMHGLVPGRRGPRPDHRLAAGQTLLAKALDLRIGEWDGRRFDPDAFFVEDAGYTPRTVVRCRRLGIPVGRDEDLMLRYVDADHVRSATQNPLTKRAWVEGRDYQLLAPKDPA